MEASPISQENTQIFETIAELVTGIEFQDACVLFMEKHVEVFDEDEENKLEYSEVFEEYVKILEQIIDSQLFQKYSEPQVKAFYKDFGTNFKIYTNMNEQAVDVLFGFTDFNKFKTQMLEVKRGDVKSKGEPKNNTEGLDESFFWNLMKEDVNDKANGW